MIQCVRLNIGAAGNAPVLNCFGLHEWAMQYQPPGVCVCERERERERERE
jgi:hypothetical protein